MTNILFGLSPEHLAMLDAIMKDSNFRSRNRVAKELLVAILEDDAMAYGMSPRDPDDKVITVNWRGRSRE